MNVLLGLKSLSSDSAVGCRLGAHGRDMCGFVWGLRRIDTTLYVMEQSAR